VLFPYNLESSQDEDLILRPGDAMELRNGIKRLKAFIRKNGMFTTSGEYLDGAADYSEKTSAAKNAWRDICGLMSIHMVMYGHARRLPRLLEMRFKRLLKRYGIQME